MEKNDELQGKDFYSWQPYKRNGKPGHWSLVHLIVDHDRRLAACGRTVPVSDAGVVFNYAIGIHGAQVCGRCREKFGSAIYRYGIKESKRKV